MMFTLQDETREQATVRFNRDGGSEADYIRSAPLAMGDGSIETLTHCQICRAHLENGFIKHLFYCPFEGAADRLREAAPMMLAACEAALIEMIAMGNRANWEAQTHEYVDAINGLRAAIAAAKGEAGPKVAHH